MLHTQTVEAGTYALLKSIMDDSTFNGFALAGGTALSLLIGHRKSIDLDLFTTGEFNPVQLEQYLQKNYAFKGDFLEGYSLKGEVNGIKLDFIRHDYPDVEPRIQEDGIRLYGLKDIAAMKLSAIGDNGTRLKDFIDVAYLSGYLSLKEMLTAFETKYPQTNPYRALKGLNYYDDIRFSERIDLLGKDFRWEDIAARLTDMTREENKHFPHLKEEAAGKEKKLQQPVIQPKKRGRRM
ncbi:hypothetical protein D0T84_05025 [Dysgonomonas sp. 521]|nr:hypothetical protein [Dysgonomonas sp. 521]